MERGRNLYTTDDTDQNLIKATELRLGLPGTDEQLDRPSRGCKRMMEATSEENDPTVETTSNEYRYQESPPSAKAQVVGWPPIRSYRKNNFQSRWSETKEAAAGAPGIYVKVSMDGAPYLRKIDINVYQSYEKLREALEDMFKCFSLGYSPGAGSGGRSNYAVAYEDKEGDWMLAGDVPWRMFISSCKRLRIMRGSEAKGLSSNS
ncbi:Auxin-induced protein 22D [Platanthera zijinensis]|uniref:Auxin-responsive protein n=1 Tax=Platanthera zijinensis TaxID=2320716 RepID=A0AAP0AWV9_9ASPA